MATRVASPKSRASTAVKEAGPDPAAAPAPWTFLTNHAHVLIHIAEEPAVRMRDIADRVGITERAVQRIVRELEDAGYLERLKEGRRNHYHVTASQPLRHPIEKHVKTSALLALVLGKTTR